MTMTKDEIEIWWKEQDRKRDAERHKAKQAELDKQAEESANRRSQAIGILMPGRTYSSHKDKIKALIRKSGANKWTGSSWQGETLVEPIFKKVMEETGQPYDYDGDQLWLTGPEDKFSELIEFSKSIGAFIKLP